MFTAELLDWLEAELPARPKLALVPKGPPLRLHEHPMPGYGPRTVANADAEATFAYGVDFSTEQQMLVREVAGERLLQVPVGTPAQEAADLLVAHLRRLGAATLNVTGNSLPTLRRAYPGPAAQLQVRVDGYLLRLLREVQREHPLTEVRSGGQSGVEEAAVRAAVTLGIPALALLPKGLTYRTGDGRDVPAERQQALLRLMPRRPLTLPPI